LPRGLQDLGVLSELPPQGRQVGGVALLLGEQIPPRSLLDGQSCRRRTAFGRVVADAEKFVLDALAALGRLSFPLLAFAGQALHLPVALPLGGQLAGHPAFRPGGADGCQALGQLPLPLLPVLSPLLLFLLRSVQNAPDLRDAGLDRSASGCR